MDNEKLNEVLHQIEKVITLLEREYCKSSKPMFELILRRYSNAKEMIEKNVPENLKEDMFKIFGGVRAYLDASSDYMNPILDELDKTEDMLEKLFN